MENFDKEIEKLSPTDREMLVETFRTVQHLDAKVNTLLALITVLLGNPALTEEFSKQVCENILEHSELLKLERMISKYGKSFS